MNRRDAARVAGVGAQLGEGPVWVARDAALWFVDIKRPRVHRFDPVTTALRSWEAPEAIGWVLPSADGAFVAGLAGGVHRFTPDDGRFTLLAEVEAELPGNRLNDATVDPDGRIWLGTMDDAEASASGRFYRLDRNGLQRCAIAPAIVTNGPAVSADGRTLYVVDSVARTIDACTILAGGELGEQRRFAAIAPEDGYPDGVSTDAGGGVWVGLWQGSAARRYDAEGRLTDEVRFPVSNVTKIALGGRDGRTAYATTARQGLDAAALAQQPLAGDLFSFRVEVPGLPAAEAALG